VFDYYGGSGTTAHSVIDLNREENGFRKYLTVEMGEHFITTTKPRVQKATYSKNWKDGKPVNRDGISHCFKYLRLESYEDTLNNLSLKTDPARERALADNPALREDYVLNYWLDVETQGSQSLLNVAAFRDPTAYTMRIKQPGSDVQRMQRIDLIETFNWLIGLWVEHMAAPQLLEAEFTREVDPLLPKDQNTRLVCKRIKPAAAGSVGAYWFRLVEGYTLKVPGDDSSRQKTLVVWRKLTENPEQDNAVLQHFLMEKLAISPREHTYAVIYVNGSHTLPNPVVEGEQTKVRLIEEAFHNAMWSQDGV
jgi:adenine-specific DNA-methyltransferase